MTKLLVNVGSGQRPFKKPWINLDINPDWKPDVVGDLQKMPWGDGEVAMVVAHHVVEHLWQEDARRFFEDAYRVLTPGGSLLVFVPNMRGLAQRWLMGEITTYTFMVNTYGAYMGHVEDRHFWGYTYESLAEAIGHGGTWRMVTGFNWREISGANIARDWWILGVEAIK